MSAPRFHFSFRSPYSWMAARRLSDLLGPDLAPFERVPFFEPNADTAKRLEQVGATCLYQPMSRARHMYILQDVKRLAGRYGLKLAWPIDGPAPNWEVPHLAYLAAHNIGRGRDVFWAIYAARWEQGQNICDPQVMAAIESELGLGDLLSSAVNNGTIQEQGALAIELGYNDSAFGVPFFVVGREKFWGQDRLDFVLEKLAGLNAV